MIGMAKKNGVCLFKEKAISSENIGVCPVCNKKIKSDNLIARKINGLWLCSINCIHKFLKEKKKWTPEEWEKLCNLQSQYEERKRAESGNAKKELAKSGNDSLVSGLC